MGIFMGSMGSMGDLWGWGFDSRLAIYGGWALVGNMGNMGDRETGRWQGDMGTWWDGDTG